MVNLPLEDLKALLVKAESTLQETFTILLPLKALIFEEWAIYSIKAKRLDDLQAYSQAQKLLEQDLFTTPEGKRQVLLKLAERTPRKCINFTKNWQKVISPPLFMSYVLGPKRVERF